MSLEGNDVFTLSSVQTAEWVMNDYARAVNYLRTRLNPELAKGLEGVLVFEIEGTRRGRHIRKCVAEYLPEVDKHYRAPDAGIRGRRRELHPLFPRRGDWRAGAGEGAGQRKSGSAAGGFRHGQAAADVLQGIGSRDRNPAPAYPCPPR